MAISCTSWKLLRTLKCKCLSQTSCHSALPHQAHVKKWILSSCSVISSEKEYLRQEHAISVFKNVRLPHFSNLKIWRWIHELISISAVKKRGSYSVITEAKLCNTSNIYKSTLDCSGKYAVGSQHGNSSIAMTANFTSHTGAMWTLWMAIKHYPIWNTPLWLTLQVGKAWMISVKFCKEEKQEWERD